MESGSVCPVDECMCAPVRVVAHWQTGFVDGKVGLASLLLSTPNKARVKDQRGSDRADLKLSCARCTLARRNLERRSRHRPMSRMPAADGHHPILPSLPSHSPHTTCIPVYTPSPIRPVACRLRPVAGLMRRTGCLSPRSLVMAPAFPWQKRQTLGQTAPA